jgi:hypothetical protein
LHIDALYHLVSDQLSTASECTLDDLHNPVQTLWLPSRGNCRRHGHVTTSLLRSFVPIAAKSSTQTSSGSSPIHVTLFSVRARRRLRNTAAVHGGACPSSLQKGDKNRMLCLNTLLPSPARACCHVTMAGLPRGYTWLARFSCCLNLLASAVLYRVPWLGEISRAMSSSIII